MLSIKNWKGKVGIVTGASSGIGAKIAETLVKHGMVVVGMSRRVEVMEENSRKFENHAGKLIAMKVDVTNDNELIESFKEIELKFGAVHVLVNSAGIFPIGSLMDGEISVWRKVMDTNLISLCVATREAMRIMRKNDDNGQIIHINSITGHYVPAFPNLNLYTASKHGVTAVTETLRQELVAIGSKIKVTSLSPGFVWTEGVDELLSGGAGDTSFLETEDIADAVLYILSTPERVNVKELIIKPVGERL